VLKYTKTEVGHKHSDGVALPSLAGKCHLH